MVGYINFDFSAADDDAVLSFRDDFEFTLYVI